MREPTDEDILDSVLDQTAEIMIEKHIYGNRQMLVNSANALSAGTISACTGERDYAEIDKIRNKFVAYCVEHPDYVSWVCAWHDFRKTREGKL